MARAIGIDVASGTASQLFLTSGEATPRPFIDHPTQIPLHYHRVADATPDQGGAAGIGIRFAGHRAVNCGCVLEVRITLNGEVHRFRGIVAAIAREGSSFTICLWIQGKRQAFAARMAEQLCHIEGYRHMRTRQRGYEMGADEAALEWIERFAADFPDP